MAFLSRGVLARSHITAGPKMLQHKESGWWFPPLENMSSSVGMILPKVKKKWSKPPTRNDPRIPIDWFPFSDYVLSPSVVEVFGSRCLHCCSCPRRDAHKSWRTFGLKDVVLGDQWWLRLANTALVHPKKIWVNDINDSFTWNVGLFWPILDHSPKTIHHHSSGVLPRRRSHLWWCFVPSLRRSCRFIVFLHGISN